MKNFTRKMVVGCMTSACLLVGANVFAQDDAKSDESPSMLPAFEVLDGDQDGKISLEEFSAEFALLDQDGSSLVEEAEAPSENFILSLDADHDVAVSLEEYQAMFTILDKDGSGFIEEAEYPQAASDAQAS